jgi:hypothetical protein
LGDDRYSTGRPWVKATEIFSTRCRGPRRWPRWRGDTTGSDTSLLVMSALRFDIGSPRRDNCRSVCLYSLPSSRNSGAAH